MHKQARLPEIFDQILNNTPVPEFGSRTPLSLPEIETLPRVQVQPYPEYPPQIENSNFLSRFQNWPYPEHPPSIENSNFQSPKSKSDLTPPPSGG